MIKKNSLIIALLLFSSVIFSQVKTEKPVTVMINGDNIPKEYKELFTLVNQSKIIGISKPRNKL